MPPPPRPPIAAEQRVYTPHRVAAVIDALAEDGVPAARALAGSGIDDTVLRAPATRVSYRQIATVFRNAIRLAREPTLALRAGRRMRLTAYGMYGYALLSSPTRQESLDFAVKYHSAMGPVAALSFRRERDAAIYGYEVLLASDPTDELYRFALEMTYAAHLTLCRDLFGRSYRFSAVRVVYPAPANSSAYLRWFRCPVQFGARSNELQIDAAWLAVPPRLPDPVTHSMAREICHRFQAELKHAGDCASTVRRTLVEQMPWRFPSIDGMAAELALQPRTLRRRLEAEGTSFREILAEVRRGLAIEYLRNTRMTNDEIATRLGYSDAANFRHAFVRWTGSSPQSYRSTGAPKRAG